jgi:UDP-GlcNAc:undecaprenyl-phosphate GlcNAc-1-phosphate transferase
LNINLQQFAILGVAAFVLTAFLTWPIRALAIRLGAMDSPNLVRKIQKEPVPYLGGVAIALGVSILTFSAFLFWVVVFAEQNSHQIFHLVLITILPALLLGAMGLIDDFLTLSPWPRLLVQSIVALAIAMTIVANGTIGMPFGSEYPTHLNIPLNGLVTILWIVGVCNSINFFDNLDGAASGFVVIVMLGVFVIAFDRGQVLVGALSILTAGATLGFLIWNRSPAKIYLGDAGALFLGVIVSVLTIRIDPGIAPTWKSLAIPVMLLAVPILDTCVAVVSRLARGLSPMTGGQDHLSHRLVRMGLSRPLVAIVLWIASGICAVMAVGVYFYPHSLGSFILGTFAIGWLLALILFLCTPSEGIST